MSLEFLYDAPDVAYRRTIADLKSMNPKIDESVFECMSIPQIDALLDRLNLREQKIIDESPYGAWLDDSSFLQIKMLQDGLNNLREYREELEESEVMAPGFTYYNGVRQFGHRIEGRLCMYLGEGRPANWINFIDSSPVMKALELVKHGSTNDFRRIYVEMANGRADGLQNATIEHIVESTDEALLEMETYCDARWEGPWPWEVAAPYRLNRIIEERKQMHQQPLVEMTRLVENMHALVRMKLREFDESGQESFEINSMIRGMSDNVQKMIEQFAKLAGDAMINLRAAVMTTQGDEGAMKVEHGLTHAVNGAADALARLKVELDHLVQELGQGMGLNAGMAGGMGGGMGGNPNMGGDPNMVDDMGGEMGAMAGDMDAGGGAGMPGAEPEMAGAEMGGAPPVAAPGGAMQPERPRKKA